MVFAYLIEFGYMVD